MENPQPTANENAAAPPASPSTRPLTSPQPVQQRQPSPALTWLIDHGDALHQFALQRVRRPELAEDLVQETLLAALTATTDFAGRSAQRTWLIGILKHKLIDHLRKSIRQNERIENELDPSADFFDQKGNWKIKPAAWPADPAKAMENAEFRKALDSCLAKLPPRIAQLFWLREADEKDSDWLCQELQISPTNLWTMLRRARLGLRQCLSVNWFGNKEK